MEKKPPTLRTSEWALAGSWCLILLTLLAIAKVQAWHYCKETRSIPLILIEVQIEGCVERPGIYEFIRGTSVEEVLRKARPKRFADLRAIDRKMAITHPLHFKIDPLSSIKVHVKGAVKKAETLEVSPGTRICDLRKKIELKEAELSFFKKRQLLSDGEVVVVPSCQ